VATFAAGGKFNHQTSLRDIATELVDPSQRNNPNAVQAALVALVHANPFLKGKTTYAGGHNLNLPNGYQKLNSGQQSAYDLMNDTLKKWGLGSLSGDLRKLIVSGDTNPDTLSLALAQTDAYKKRFAGNAARVKAGLSELSPAEYIGLEGQYKQILSQFGIPKGFYDSQAETDAWIAGDVSPSEMADRAKAVSDLVFNSPKEAMQAWNQYYGGGTGGAIAGILDPTKAEPLVLQHATAAGIGGQALTQGLTLGKNRAEEFAQNGVTIDSARQAYAQIAGRLSTDQTLSGRFGQTFGQTEEENATLLGSGADLQKQAALYSMESGEFGGRAGGATEGSVSVSDSY
jgi:hypothetical protein